MFWKRPLPLRLGVLAGSGVVVAVLATAAWALVAGRSVPAVDVTFEAGGFALDLPEGWAIGAPDPDKPLMWVQAERVSRAGLASGWLWVVRWSPGGDDPLAAAADAALADIEALWGDVDVARTRTHHGGHPAIALRYWRPFADLLPSSPVTTVEELRVLTISAGQVYEIGVGGWPRLPREASALDRHVPLVPPSGTRTLADVQLGMEVSLPAGWNLEPWLRSDESGIAWAAAGSHNPASEWARLWVFDTPLERAIADSLAAAERDGTVRAHTETVLAGRRAVRIEFEQSVPHIDRAFFTTWHFEGPDGKAWQLLVGGREPVTELTTMVETTLRLRD